MDTAEVDPLVTDLLAEADGIAATFDPVAEDALAALGRRADLLERAHTSLAEALERVDRA